MKIPDRVRNWIAGEERDPEGSSWVEKLDPTAAPVLTVAAKMLTHSSLPDGMLVYSDFAPCRYDLLAEALGAHGEHVTDSSDLAAALARARDCGRAAVVQVDVDNVEHLWAPGLQAFKKMHQEPKG